MLAAAVCIPLFGCGGGSDDAEHAGASGSGNGAATSAGGTKGDGASGGRAGDDGSGAVSSGGAPTYGRFGDEPENTFTLPVPTAANGDLPVLYHPDLAKDFPEVDFATLDRLYVPAGEYKTILLGKLPERSAERPLVITNLGGQVKVGGQAANYVFSIGGGRNWILTGRFDPTSKTGDEGFKGHAEGAYAHSQGSYGFFIDDAFSKEGLTGLAIGGGASDFELDCIEITRAEFAGITAKTDNDGAATMRNVKLQTVNDKSIFTQPMTKVAGPVKANGGIEGTGSTLIVEHTADNNLVTFRFKNADVKMAAAEEDFELNGRKFRAGSIVIGNADRAKLEPMLRDLGLSAWAVASEPRRRTWTGSTCKAGGGA